jgi:hypothetical protein
MQPDAATANYDLAVLTDFRATRFQQSIDNNPYFFNGPFSGVVVQPAAYTFIYRFMANKSAEYPEGILNQDVLKSFYSIIGDEYTVPFFFSDLLAAAEKYPQFLDIGGNTGKTDTFTGVDIQDLTGGVFNAATLLQGDNAICFAFQALQQAAPDLLKGLVTNVAGTMNQLDGEITNLLSGLVCPELNSYDVSQFDKYPGADNCAGC